MARVQIALLRELVDLLRRQRTEQFLRQLAQERVAQAVDAFEMFEKQHEPFEMRGLEFAVDAVKRMRNRVGNIRSWEITLQCENIFPVDVDGVVMLSGNAPDRDVNLAGGRWK